MSGLKDLAKKGWHPKGKDGGKESWRGESKGINTVVRLCALPTIPALSNFEAGRMGGQGKATWFHRGRLRAPVGTSLEPERSRIVCAAPQTRSWRLKLSTYGWQPTWSASRGLRIAKTAASSRRGSEQAASSAIPGRYIGVEHGAFAKATCVPTQSGLVTKHSNTRKTEAIAATEATSTAERVPRCPYPRPSAAV